jgi:hypothetical protein
MRYLFKTLLVTALLTASVLPGVQAAMPGASAASTGEWVLPTIGTGQGTWDTSVGIFFWKDKFSTRNLQFRSDIDLGPGLRYHTLVRSNQQFDTLSGFSPRFDENYLEGYGYQEDKQGRLSASLRVGAIRYLHFPYPDSIAMFDQVPGIGDLQNQSNGSTATASTGYSGEMATLDYAAKSGWGAHATGLRWDFGRNDAADDGQSHNRTGLLEDYLFYRTNVGALHLETHVGGLAVRTEPLGNREIGFNVFAGFGSVQKGLSVGLLYEKLRNTSAYTGILMSFPLDPVTAALGKVVFDYDRSPQGFAMQIPLLDGTYGNLAKVAPADGVLVGEVKAERLRTYWQNGQARNYYEHRLSAWGDTSGKGTVTVMVEQPWYLQAEALVSPNNFSDLKKWERERQGPAQLSQSVVYQYYRHK